MNLKQDILWLDVEEKLLMMSMKNNSSLSITGDLKISFLKYLGKETDLNLILASLSETEKNQVIKIFEKNSLIEGCDHSDSVEFECVKFSDGSKISFIELAHNKGSDSFEEYSVFAKYPDPTSIVGSGGYDDDTAATMTTMYAF